MNKMRVLKVAALAAFALAARCGVAGFADGLDFSELLALDADVQEKCFNINVTCNGSKDGESIWKPLGVSVDANYKLVFDAQAGMTANIPRLEDYISFGKYSDSASIDAFFSDAMFNDGRGRLRVEATELSDMYVQAEQFNVDLFEKVNEQIAKNLEEYLASLDTNTSGGASKYNQIVNAYKKFAESAEKNKASRQSTLKALIQNKSAALKNAQSAVDIAKYSAQLKAATAALKNFERIENKISVIYTEFVTHMKDYAKDMNTLGAYLGSTNAMEYFAHDWTEEDILDIDNWKRWGKFSPPEKLKKSPSYYTDFNVGGKEWYTILHNLQSQLFLQAEPIEGLEEVRDHFGMSSASMNNFRGFYEFDDYVPGETGHVTNWYANSITAPKNWADGETLIVTNGKFSVKPSYALAFYGNDGSATSKQTAIVVGSGSTTNYVGFASATDSNVKVSCAGDSNGGVIVTIGVYYK